MPLPHLSAQTLSSLQGETFDIETATSLLSYSRCGRREKAAHQAQDQVTAGTQGNTPPSPSDTDFH